MPSNKRFVGREPVRSAEVQYEQLPAPVKRQVTAFLPPIKEATASLGSKYYLT
ncbi:MAG: hypothetical protein QXI19_04855 [Candidatus Caldarchaeum sp.]